MESRFGLLISLFALLSLGLNDGTDAAPEPDEYYAPEGKWETNEDSRPNRLPLSESSFLLGLDPRQRAGSRHEASEDRWPLADGELDEQGMAARPFANRLAEVLAPASKRPQNGLGPRMHRGVGMMRMG